MELTLRKDIPLCSKIILLFNTYYKVQHLFLSIFLIKHAFQYILI